MIFGKTLAQAYDMSAYKIAADDGLVASTSVEILFHAHGAGEVMQDDGGNNALAVETKAGRQAVRAQMFIDCSGDGDLAEFAGARSRTATTRQHAVSLDDVPRELHRSGKSGRRVERDSGADAAAQAAALTIFRARRAIVRRSARSIEWRVNLTQFARATVPR